MTNEEKDDQVEAETVESGARSGLPDPSEFDALSDRELDALIAERVLGWLPLVNDGDGWGSPDGKVRHWPGPPECSTDISAAMQVIESLANQGLMVTMMDTCERWNVCFDGARKGHEASDSLLPRAICLAALRAVTGETK